MSDYRMEVTFKSEVAHDALRSWLSSSVKGTTGGFLNWSGKTGDRHFVVAYIPEMPAALWRADPEEFTRILARRWEQDLGLTDVLVTVEGR